MINFPRATKNIHPANLQAILYDKELIAVLAKQLVAQQVEAHIDMASDCGAEYTSFKEAENCLQGAKETVADVIEDLLVEFREALYSAARESEIKVTKVHLSAYGFEDAEVEVL